MENRDRDKLSRNTTGTEAGDVNRSTSENLGKDKSDSSAEFGQKIGRAENLNEPNRRTGVSDESGMRGSMGRPSGSETSSDLDKNSDTNEGRH